ncbi:MAG: hypothetical protein ACI8S6_004222 [Myxococcota bacterium]
MHTRRQLWWIGILWAGLLGAAVYSAALIIGLLSTLSATPTPLDAAAALLLLLGMAGSLAVASATVIEDEAALRVRLLWGATFAVNSALQLVTLWGLGAL